MFLLRLRFGGVEDEAGIARDVQGLEFEIGGAIDEERAPVVEGQVSLPLRVGEAGLRAAQRLLESGHAPGKVGIRGEEGGDGGFFGHGPGGLADEVDDAVALADVGVEFLERRAAGDDEILLHGDVEVGPLEIARQQMAAGSELAAHRGEEEFRVVPVHPAFPPKITRWASASSSSRR